MSHKILGDMKGLYAQMHRDAALEAVIEDIIITVAYNMLSEGKSVDEIVEVLGSEDDEVILEHYAAAQYSTTLTEDLDYGYYTEDFELVCEKLGLIKGLFGLAKGAAGLAFKGGKAVIKGAAPIVKSVTKGATNLARSAKVNISRALGPKGRQILRPVVNIAKKTAIPALAAGTGYLLGKSTDTAKTVPEVPAAAPSGDGGAPSAPSYPGGQTKAEGEKINKEYEKLRQKAVDAKGKIKDPEAVKAAEKKGKEEWAKLYPELAKKVKPDSTQKGTGESEMEKQAEILRADQQASQARQEVDKRKLKKEAYEVVLDYLLSEGHADTVEEAHYVMMQMDAENIQSIVEMGDPSFPIKRSTGAGALTPDAAKQLGPKAMELQKRKAAGVSLPKLPDA